MATENFSSGAVQCVLEEWVDERDQIHLLDNQEDVFLYRGAVARCREVDGVLQIDYSGGVSQSGFHRLDALTQPLRMRAPVALECMDRAFTVVSEVVVCDAAWPPGTPPSAVVVRDDQYQFAAQFAARLADLGILRAVFRQQHAQRALRFCRLHQVKNLRPRKYSAL